MKRIFNNFFGRPVALMVVLSLTAGLILDTITKLHEEIARGTLSELAEWAKGSVRGEVVVVNFWASWCAPCLKELPVLDRWHTAWAGRGARVVAISVDKDARKAKRFADDAELSLTVFHDGPAGLARTLDLPSLPCTFLLDRDGNVVSMIKSSSAKDLALIENKAESLLASTRHIAGTPNDGGRR